MNRSWLRRLHLVIGFYFAGLTFIVGTAGCTVVALLGWPWAGRSSARRAFRLWLHRFLRSWFVFLRVLGLARTDFEPIDQAGPIRGRVLVAPHFSLLDALVVFAALPDTVCVFKRSLVRHPAFGPLARLCGHLGNGSGPDLFRSARAALADGTNVLFFPEGTRRPDRACGRVHAGFALAALKAQVPVQVLPLTIPPGLLTKHQPPWRVPPGEAPLTLRVEPGPLLPVTPETRTADLVEQVRIALGGTD